MELRTTLLEVPWRAPLAAAHDLAGIAAPARPLILVALTAADGLTGYGEAAPLTSYDGVTVEQTLAALHGYATILADAESLAWSEILLRCQAAAPLPQALAAVDLALWDLAGQRGGEPIWGLLEAGVTPGIPVNATIGAVEPAAAAAEAEAAISAGFDTLKVKVASGDDVARVAAVRAAAGDSARLRIDANGGWTVREAVDRIAALAEFGLELCEEPVHGVAGLADVAAHTDVPISADESARELLATEGRLCTAVCLKVGASAGITGLLGDAALAQEAGYEVYLASTLDGPLGIAAALDVAAVIEPDRACGLATLPRFDREDPLPARAGRIAVPAGTGLSDGLLQWYR
jgi:L-alanine-DL-glutamate epimerase-like enolase superfamily enzyme